MLLYGLCSQYWARRRRWVVATGLHRPRQRQQNCLKSFKTYMGYWAKSIRHYICLPKLSNSVVHALWWDRYETVSDRFHDISSIFTLNHNLAILWALEDEKYHDIPSVNQLYVLDECQDDCIRYRDNAWREPQQHSQPHSRMSTQPLTKLDHLLKKLEIPIGNALDTVWPLDLVICWQQDLLACLPDCITCVRYRMTWIDKGPRF